MLNSASSAMLTWPLLLTFTTQLYQLILCPSVSPSLLFYSSFSFSFLLLVFLHLETLFILLFFPPPLAQTPFSFWSLPSYYIMHTFTTKLFISALLFIIFLFFSPPCLSPSQNPLHFTFFPFSPSLTPYSFHSLPFVLYYASFYYYAVYPGLGFPALCSYLCCSPPLCLLFPPFV